MRGREGERENQRDVGHMEEVRGKGKNGKQTRERSISTWLHYDSELYLPPDFI